MIPHVAAVAVLTLVYALALASFHPWDLAFGAALAAVLLHAVRPSESGSENAAKPLRQRHTSFRRCTAFFPFAVAVARDVMFGTWRVLLVTVGLRSPASPGIVAVPLGERTPTGVAVSAFLAAFSPDTLLVDVDEEERIMLIHVMNATDPDAVRESQETFYRRYQQRVFP